MVVRLLRQFLAARFDLGFEDVGDVVVFFGGQAEQLKPVGWRYQFQIVLGDTAHEQELILEEVGIHLLGLEGEEAAEAADRLGVKSLSGIGPGKGVSKGLVPGLNKGENVGNKLFDRREVVIVQTPAFENAEPDLHHV